MKKLLLLAAIVAGAVPSVAFPSTVETVRGTLDLSGVVLTCPSENVVLSGIATYTETDSLKQIGPAAWQHQATFLFNLNGLSATGQTSGTQYRVAGVTASGFSFSFGTADTADVSRFVQTWRLIPSGGGSPLSFQETLIAIYNPSDSLVVLVDQQPGGCD